MILLQNVPDLPLHLKSGMIILRKASAAIRENNQSRRWNPEYTVVSCDKVVFAIYFVVGRVFTAVVRRFSKGKDTKPVHPFKWERLARVSETLFGVVLGMIT